ncbi:MAG: class I SAM-dependent methyltransferase [Pseudomonadota bacterium]
MSDAETLRVYARKAPEYQALTEKGAGNDPLFQAFLAALPAGADVLDLGCGPGHFAAAMAAAGHRPRATDAAPEFVEMAGQHPGVRADLASFDDIDEIGVYDGIWANFSLLHAARKDVPRHLKALHRALKPGGVFHISVKEGEGSKRDELGRLYTYFTDAELSAMLHDAGFTVTDRAQGQEMGLDKVMAPWIALRAHA